MSWWDSADDVLGDEPADKLIGAWRTLLARRSQVGQGKPTQQQALDSFVAAASASGVPMRLALLRGDARVAVFDGSAAVADVQAAVSEVLPAIARDYLRQTERGPSAMELAKTLAFILRPQPENYLSDATAEQWQFARLVSE